VCHKGTGLLLATLISGWFRSADWRCVGPSECPTLRRANAADGVSLKITAEGGFDGLDLSPGMLIAWAGRRRSSCF
jgi:hypothetical protein